MEKIIKLEGLQYDLKKAKENNTGSEKEKEFKEKRRTDRLGFIAQDVQSILPEIVVYDKENDKYYIDYVAIIPVLVEAIKEQQAQNEILISEVEKLKTKANLKSAQINQTDSEVFETATLAQNIPNPFNQSTKINMYLPFEITKATLYVYTMQGAQISKYEIYERGDTFVVIEAHSLNAGIYLYSLIADGKEVDTKKMILTN